MAIEKIRLDKIILDPELQFREKTDEATVTKYAEALESGNTLPPPTVFRDEVDRVWMADGFHRHEAHRRVGDEDTDFDIHEGSRADALVWAMRSNEEHGKERDDFGRVKAMKTLFIDNPNMMRATTEQVKEHLGMSRRTTDRIRNLVNEELRKEGVEVPTTRVGKDGKEYPARFTRKEDLHPQNVSAQSASVSVEPSETDTVRPTSARSSATDKPKADRKRDAVGAIIPDALLDVFGDEALLDVVAIIEEAVKPLSGQGLLSKLYARSRHLPHLDLSQLEEHVRDGVGHFLQAIQCLKSAVPHMICSSCKGSGCDRCRHAGYLPQWRQEESQQFGEAA